MSKLARWIIGLACIGLALATLLILLKNVIATSVVVSQIKTQTGFESHVSGVELGVFNRKILIKQVELLNPSSYKTRRVALAHNVQTEWNLVELLKGRVRLTEVQIEFDEIILVRNSARELNVAAADKLLRKHLDSGSLRIGRLIYSLAGLSYTDEAKPDHEMYKVDCKVHERLFTPLESSGDLTRLIKEVTKEASGSTRDLMGTFLKNAWRDFEGLFH